MAGILRLNNTGTGNGQSTITTAASGDTTYTLPSGGGTFVTTASTQALTVPFASGTAGAPSVTFIGDTDTGLYSPSANNVAISTNGTGRLFVDASGVVDIYNSTPKLGFSSVGSFYNWIECGGVAGDNYMRFATANTERMRLGSSGRLGLGTSSAGDILHVKGGSTYAGVIADNSATTGGGAFRAYRNGVQKAIFCVDSWVTGTSSDDAAIYADAGGGIKFYTNNSSTAKAYLTSGGSLGIGTTTVNAKLEVVGGNIRLDNNQGLEWAGSNNYIYGNETSDFIAIATNGTERSRWDSSGRFLVGTSSYSGNGTIIAQGHSGSSAGPAHVLLKLGSTSPTSGGDLGYLFFSDANTSGGFAAWILGQRDGGTWTSGSSMPGRLVFSTSSDSSASPSERLRITSSGNLVLFNSDIGFYPATDNAYKLGETGARWSQVWAANGTIQTSDERAKTEITDAQLGSDFIKSLRPVSYKWIEGGKVDSGNRDEKGNYIYESVPGQRTHWGFIAQEVKQAVDYAGVDFGGWVLTDKDDPDSQQALRYDQFIAPLTKALQEALAKIETLEAKVNALEGN